MRWLNPVSTPTKVAFNFFLTIVTVVNKTVDSATKYFPGSNLNSISFLFSDSNSDIN